MRDAKTVYQIQRKASRLAAIQVDSSQLYKWIREHNKNKVDQVTINSLPQPVLPFINILRCSWFFVDNVMQSNISCRIRGISLKLTNIRYNFFLSSYKSIFEKNDVATCFDLRPALDNAVLESHAKYLLSSCDQVQIKKLSSLKRRQSRRSRWAVPATVSRPLFLASVTDIRTTLWSSQVNWLLNSFKK